MQILQLRKVGRLSLSMMTLRLGEDKSLGKSPLWAFHMYQEFTINKQPIMDTTQLP